MPKPTHIPAILPSLPLGDTGRLNFSWVRPVHRARILLAFAAGTLCVLSLWGVYSPQHVFLSMAGERPGTHPLTAICGLLLALGLASFRPNRQMVRAFRLTVWLALCLALLRLVEFVALPGAPASMALLPASFETHSGISTGVNTALTILALAFSLLVGRIAPYGALALVALALFLPSVSLLGYLCGIKMLHGAMSPVTAVIYLFLAIASACLFAKKRAFRILLRGDVLGRLARRQILLSNLFFIGCGYVFVQMEARVDLPGTAIIVMLATWFVTGMVIISTQYYDMDDRLRRKRERDLLAETLTDSLTGVANRRAAYLTGHAAFDAALQENTQLSVLVIDLDNFKAVNDTYGHAAGDAVLRETAGMMAARLRRSDILARWGGEEFLVLLPGAGSADATAVAEELRELVEGGVMPPGGLGGTPVTISVGVSEMVRNDVSLSYVIERADRALYAAKKAGRNVVASCRELAFAQFDVTCAQSDSPCHTCPLHSATAVERAGSSGIQLISRSVGNHIQTGAENGEYRSEQQAMHPASRSRSNGIS